MSSSSVSGASVPNAAFGETQPGPEGAATIALAVRDAARSFGDVRALEGATVELFEGERLALLGPNGAGKTTLLRAITGRVRLTRGRVELFGRAIDDERRREWIGIVPQEIAIYPLLTARENLDAFGRLNGVAVKDLRERVAWALEWTGLADRANRPVGQFSGGMKRRLNIACGVLHRPRIVMLDEPTVGVDPQSRERIYDMLDELRRSGATMLLTTHQLEEAEVRCDRIAILDHGRMIASGSLRELVERTVGGGRVVTLVLERPAANSIEGFDRSEDGRRLSANVSDIGAELPVLIGRARQAGCAIQDVEVQRHGLHEVFLQLTGKDLRE